MNTVARVQFHNAGNADSLQTEVQNLPAKNTQIKYRRNFGIMKKNALISK